MQKTGQEGEEGSGLAVACLEEGAGNDDEWAGLEGNKQEAEKE